MGFNNIQPSTCLGFKGNTTGLHHQFWHRGFTSHHKSCRKRHPGWAKAMSWWRLWSQLSKFRPKLPLGKEFVDHAMGRNLSTPSFGLECTKLVGGLEHEFYFSHHIGNFIIPFDFHIFQRGRSTTNQKMIRTCYSFLGCGQTACCHG